MAIDGGDYSDGPLLPPYYVRGWTSQHEVNIPNPSSAQGFDTTFPASVVDVMVQQNYFDGDQNPLGGFLTFMPSSAFTVTASDSNPSIRVPRRLCGTETWPGVDAGVSPWAFSMEGSGRIYIWKGILLVMLFASDNEQVVTDDGKPLSYHVVEHFQGGRQFDILVPKADVSTYPSLYDLVVPGSIDDADFDPINPFGEMEPEGEWGLNVDEDVPPSVKFIAHASTEYVTIDVGEFFQGTGVPVNPTDDDVYFAFLATPGAEPGVDDWLAGAWVSGGPPYLAQILIGPANDGLVLAIGTYSIWFQLIDTPEQPAAKIGTLYIT